MKMDFALDTTLAVTAGIDEIMHTLLEAVALVIFVVFIFLQDWRATLIPLLTVPVSLIGTFIVFPLLGFSVNVLSLLGLVLAIGLVVDDAIVVVEAVMHHIEHGMSPKDATSKAMKEVGGPVVIPHLYDGHNRTFFYMYYDGYRFTNSNNATVYNLLTPAMRTGNFSAAGLPAIYDPNTTQSNGQGGFTRTPYAGNTIPAGQISPISKYFAGLFPEPNRAGLTSNYVGTSKSITQDDQGLVKINQALHNGSLSISYNDEPETITNKPCASSPAINRISSRAKRRSTACSASTCNSTSFSSPKSIVLRRAAILSVFIARHDCPWLARIQASDQVKKYAAKNLSTMT